MKDTSKHLLARLLSASLILCAMTPLVNAGDNRVQNGDAETNGVAGWTGIAATAPTSHSGANALVLEPSKTGEMAVNETLIPVTADAVYELAAFFKAAKEKDNVNIGLACYDGDKKQILSRHVAVIQGTETELTEEAKVGDTIVKIKQGAKWQFDPSWTERYGYVTFNVDDSGAYRDLPNREQSGPGIKAIRQAGEHWEVELALPLKQGYPAGTKVREQRAKGVHCSGSVKEIETDWIEVKRRVKGISQCDAVGGEFWPGTRFVKISIVKPNNQPVLVDDISFHTVE